MAVRSLTQVDIPALLDQMGDMVEGSKQFFGRRLINEEEFFFLLNRIKAALPEELRKAGRLARDTERYKTEARAEAEEIKARAYQEAEKIIKEAEAKAAQLVNESEIKRLATEQAREIKRQAEEEAQRLRQEAEAWVWEQVNRLESYVSGVMSSLRKAEQERIQAEQRRMEELDQFVSSLMAQVQKCKQYLERGPSG
jgi:F0F1-type ATP synthase membrane subunit b/b'